LRISFYRQFTPKRAIAADLRRREQQHPERLVFFPPKPARGKKTA